MKKKIAIFPGSFDPFHKGHRWVVNNALLYFDEVVICVATNYAKKGYFEPKARVSIIENIFKDDDRIKVVSTDGLVIDKAKEVGAIAIVKGARNGKDFEDEVVQADINRIVGGIPTLIIPTPNSLSYVSSTAIRSLLQTSKGQHDIVKDMMC